MKLIHAIQRIPRPIRACCYAILAIMTAIAFYIALGCPTLSFRQEFRRAEKAHLVGPSQIVDTMNGEYIEFDKMIVGETENGICFFGRYYSQYPYKSTDEKQYFFSFIEKTGDITIAAAPNVWGIVWQESKSIPVYLFVNQPNAVRAEITLKATTYFEATFHAEATRLDSGVFRFWLEAEGKDLEALSIFSRITGGAPYIGLSDELLDTAIPATVKLYDTDGALILEEELIIKANQKR